jgi:hypothetical protein
LELKEKNKLKDKKEISVKKLHWGKLNRLTKILHTIKDLYDKAGGLEAGNEDSE